MKFDDDEFVDLAIKLTILAFVTIAVVFISLYLIPFAAMGIGYMMWKHNPARNERRENELNVQLYERALRLYSPQNLKKTLEYNKPEYVPEGVFNQFVPIAREIMREEGVTEEVPKLPISTLGIEAGRWRDKIASLDTNPEVIDDIAFFFNQVGLKVPHEAIEGDLQVPLSYFLTYDELYEYGLYLKGFVKYANTFESKTPKEDIVSSSCLGSVMDIQVPFAISDKIRNEHVWLLGSTGTGKTTAMKYLIAQDLPHVWNENRSVVVLESKGDLYKSMLELEYDYSSQVVVLDVSDIEYPLALNLFAVGKDRINSYSPLEKERLTNTIIELYEYVLSSLMGDASMTSKQTVVFRYITRLMLLIPDATLLTMADLLEVAGENRYGKYIEQLDGIPRQFFDNEFSDKSQFASTRKEVLRRLYQVLENKTFRQMFSSPENKVDLFNEMNAGKLILIYADKSLLRTEASQIFVRFIIAMITQASQERLNMPENKRIRTHIYIDEAHEFLDKNAETLLAQARASNIGICVANQYMSQLSPPLQAAFSVNTNTKIFGSAETPEARKLGPMISADPELLRGLKKGEFAVWQKGIIPKAIPIQFPVNPFKDLDKASGDQREWLIDESRQNFATKIVDEKPTTAGEGFTMKDEDPEPRTKDPDNVDETGEW